ncbi:hypothetical protein HZA39_03470 [Candidatus Peregrinibacteria bacterium]|nr:hypothetical protein [Candidatus Peregrinibacteria bacterium]
MDENTTQDATGTSDEKPKAPRHGGAKKPAARKKAAPKTAAIRKPRRKVKSPSTEEIVAEGAAPIQTISPTEEVIATPPEAAPKEKQPAPPAVEEEFFQPMGSDAGEPPSGQPTEPSWEDLSKGFVSEPGPQTSEQELAPEPMSEPEPSPAPEYKPEPQEELKHVEPPSSDEKVLPEERFSSAIEEIRGEAAADVEDEYQEKKSIFEIVPVKKILGYLAIFALIAGIVVGLFFGGKFLWNKFVSPEPLPPPQQEGEMPSQPDFISSTIDIALKTGELYVPSETGMLTPSLQVAYMIGEPPVFASGINTGLQAAYLSGFQGPLFEDNAFKKYVRIYNEMRNAYSTDIYGILNNSTDRAAELNNQLALLEDVHSRGLEQYDLITKEMGSLKADYKNIQDPKTASEKKFFEDLKIGLPDESYGELSAYIVILQKQDEIKARHNALTALSDYYKILLQKLNVRIRDIKTNRDALVQGVRVYEVPGSNVDVIIKNTKSKAKTDSLESVSEFSIIPRDAAFPVPQLKIEQGASGFNVPGMGTATK